MRPEGPTLRLLAGCLMLVFGAIATRGQEGMPEMTPEMQAEMEAWRKLAQPGEHHQHLGRFIGRWNGAVQMWMDPDGEPLENEGSAEVSWVMGNRFLLWELTGDFGGIPWQGLSIEGYNNGDQRYESSWIDTFGTVMLFSMGSCSDHGGSRVMNTEFTDAMGGDTIRYRSVYTWLDDDHFTYETFMDKGQGEVKNLLITYERR